MARPGKRERLEEGLKLDLNKLMRDGLGQPGKHLVTIWWFHSYSNDEIASGCLSLTRESEDRARVRIMMGKIDQRIDLVAQPRHFGGQQWYFTCPITRRKCSVIWMPPGKARFASRQA
jgi:hypothetical protein